MTIVMIIALVAALIVILEQRSDINTLKDSNDKYFDTEFSLRETIDKWQIMILDLEEKLDRQTRLKKKYYSKLKNYE